jgi:hypothetical protein
MKKLKWLLDLFLANSTLGVVKGYNVDKAADVLTFTDMNGKLKLYDDLVLWKRVGVYCAASIMKLLVDSVTLMLPILFLFATIKTLLYRFSYSIEKKVILSEIFAELGFDLTWYSYFLYEFTMLLIVWLIFYIFFRNIFNLFSILYFNIKTLLRKRRNEEV